MTEMATKVKEAEAKATEEAKKADADEERLAIESYRDEDNANGEIDSKYVDYVKARYEQIKGDFVTLMCNQREAERSKNEEMKTRLNALFAANYRARKWAVLELRACGETVKDRHIPG